MSGAQAGSKQSKAGQVFHGLAQRDNQRVGDQFMGTRLSLPNNHLIFLPLFPLNTSFKYFRLTLRSNIDHSVSHNFHQINTANFTHLKCVPLAVLALCCMSFTP